MDTCNIEKERVNVAHGFRGFSLWSVGLRQKHHGAKVWRSAVHGVTSGETLQEGATQRHTLPGQC